ncbi:hypothetical protein ACHAWF_006258 [Thalassiosira exigua]
MKRAENCVNAKINHIRFGSDCLVFEFAKSKTQQTGELHGPWHVYANPKNPHICPVLAMARYLFCYPDVLQGDVPLFEGTNQYARYSSRMLQLYRKCTSELLDLGINAANLGSHSAHKGVGTMAASGCTVGPSIVSLCLRAGWTLGGVKDKYLFRENAGDMYVGRCASGHGVDNKNFAISPAYFDYSELDTIEKDRMKSRINDHLSSRLPGSSNFPPNAWRLAKYCFASICYSYEYLSEMLHNACPLRNAAVFRDIPEDIVKLAQVRYSWDSTEDTPKLTGIPPHVVQLAKLEGLERKLATVKDDIISHMKSEMESRGFSSTQFKTSEITDAIADIADKVVKELLDRTDICKRAAADATTEAIMHQDRPIAFVLNNEDDDWCDAQMAIAEVSDCERSKTEERRQAERCMAHAAVTDSVKKRQLKVGYHHGTLNPLPRDWKFSSTTSLQLVQNWFIGDLKRNIPPLSTLDSKNVEYLKQGNHTRGKMVCFMKVIEAEAREKDVWIEKLGDWDYRSVTRMWDAIQDDFTAKYAKTRRRKKELSWTTVYNKCPQ